MRASLLALLLVAGCAPQLSGANPHLAANPQLAFLAWSSCVHHAAEVETRGDRQASDIGPLAVGKCSDQEQEYRNALAASVGYSAAVNDVADWKLRFNAEVADMVQLARGKAAVSPSEQVP
jgi:hypothetical protein